MPSQLLTYPCETFVDPRVVTSADTLLTLNPPDRQRLVLHFLWRFLDLCRLLETLVLHENIVITDVEGSGAYAWNDSVFLGPFIASGIAEVRRHRWEGLGEARKALNEDPDDIRGRIRLASAWTFDQFLHAATRGMSFVPPVVGWWTVTAARLREVMKGESDESLRQFTSSIIAQIETLAGTAVTAETRDVVLRTYSSFSEELTGSLRILQSYGSPIPLAIPPVAAIVFNEARDVTSVGKVALSLRSQLEPHRKRLRDFERQIHHDNCTVGEALTALSDLQSSLRELSKIADGKTQSIAIAGAKGVVDVFGSVAAGNPTGAAMAAGKALLGEPLTALGAAFRNREVSYVAVLRERFLNIHSYSTLIERLFGHALTLEECNHAIMAFQTWNSVTE